MHQTMTTSRSKPGVPLVELFRGHDAFSMPMEVLCMLPKLPDLAPMQLIAEDLGYKDLSSVRRIIANLRDLGFDIRTGNVYGHRGRGAGIDRSSWAYAQQEAQLYLRIVYGDGQGRGSWMPTVR